MAFADLYQDKLDSARQKYPDATAGFVGEKAFEQLAESKDVDAIVIATPAYKHPEHLEAQKLGRTKYYEMYDIKVAQVAYHHHHERKTEAATGA